MADKEKKDEVFNLNGIRRLIELMKENNVSELDYEQDGSRLALRRALPSAPAAVVPAAPAPSAPVASASSAAAPAKDPDYVKIIKSPMVGVFYASPNPEAPAFVKVGDVVNPEKVVCIIEAMKVFNDIPAEISGKIIEVIAQSGDAVEFGTPLFKVDAR